MLHLAQPSFTAPRMRVADRDLLSLAFMDSRNTTLRWARAHETWLRAAEHGEGPLASAPGVAVPLVALAQIGWYQERWIARNLHRHRGPRADPAAPRLGSIDPDADARHDPAQAGQGQADAAPPGFDATLQYLADTLDTTLDLLAHAGPDDASLYFFRLALFHEDRQAETFAAWSQAAGLPAPPGLPEMTAVGRRPPIGFPAARWVLGSGIGSGFAYDNEQPSRPQQVPAFEIDAQAVSWAQYAEFILDGGYDDAQWWSEAGWAWVQREGRRSPRHVVQVRHGVLAERFGHTLRLPADHAAVHVTWHEAAAWCLWAGRRLPTELEWEYAAHAGASRGFRWGQVWEWTASRFRPYDGFIAGPDASVSMAAFDGHRALRGASFATSDRLRHAKYRLALPGEWDDAFTGFRSCAR